MRSRRRQEEEEEEEEAQEEDLKAGGIESSRAGGPFEGSGCHN